MARNRLPRDARSRSNRSPYETDDGQGRDIFALLGLARRHGSLRSSLPPWPQVRRAALPHQLPVRPADARKASTSNIPRSAMRSRPWTRRWPGGGANSSAGDLSPWRLSQEHSTEPQLAGPDRAPSIHAQPSHGGSPGGREPGDLKGDGIHPKVLTPRLGARIEQRGELAGFGIAGAAGRSFPQIARAARQGQVFQFVWPAEHTRDNVVDLELEVEDDLGRPAVLAPMPSTARDEFIEPMGHAPSGRPRRRRPLRARPGRRPTATSCRPFALPGAARAPSVASGRGGRRALAIRYEASPLNAC